jgi:2-haloacid dehalogenase
MNFSRFRALTFDCYGTLIDWETGILRALRAVLAPRGIDRPDDELLEGFARIESPIQQGPFLRYRAVLDQGMLQLARHLGFDPTPGEVTALSASLPSWPPFPDTVAALDRLRRHYRLGIISNVDDDLFAGSARLLGGRFDWIVTAESVRSYKPSRNNFHRALERIGLPRDQVLHVAQSLYHDIEPARSLGLATVWVNRRGLRGGSGATPPSAAKPDLEVPNLATLAELAG